MWEALEVARQDGDGGVGQERRQLVRLERLGAPHERTVGSVEERYHLLPRQGRAEQREAGARHGLPNRPDEGRKVSEPFSLAQMPDEDHVALVPARLRRKRHPCKGEGTRLAEPIRKLDGPARGRGAPTRSGARPG